MAYSGGMEEFCFSFQLHYLAFSLSIFFSLISYLNYLLNDPSG